MTKDRAGGLGAVATGLALAALLGAGLIAAAAVAGRERALTAAFEREALLDARAAAEVAARALEAGGDASARAALGAWASTAPLGSALRLARVDERTLVFSTAAADGGVGELPRRLTREEKPLFDLGQRLRAAVEAARAEGRAREDQVAVERLAGGGLSVAAPVEREGAVVGLVLLEIGPAPSPEPSRVAGYFLAVAKPVLPFLVLLAIFFRGARAARLRAALVGVGALLLLLGLWLAERRSVASLFEARAAAETALGERLAATGERAAAALAAAAVPAQPPLAPALWDGDLTRTPREALAADGSVRPEALAAERGRLERGGRRVLAGVATLALLLHGFVGLGGAGALWRALVRYRVAYAYSLPALAGMLVLVFLPFLYGIALSFTNSNIYNTDESVFEIWIGFDNYREILGDFTLASSEAGERTYDYHNFYWTLFFTVVWTVSNVAFGVSLGLLLALVLNTRGLRGKVIYRVILILPWAMPNYITALIWKGMFHQQFGVVNQFVQMFGGQPISWFESPWTSFATVLTTNGWLSFPFMMVISLGALQSIPADLYEAARVDGASRWQQFRAITLPSLKPALVPAIIISVIWTFNQFNIIYLVSQGEPAGATEILITEAYKIAFEQYRYGYAAAYSTVIFVILLFYGVWQNRVTRASEGI